MASIKTVQNNFSRSFVYSEHIRNGRNAFPEAYRSWQTYANRVEFPEAFRRRGTLYTAAHISQNAIAVCCAHVKAAAAAEEKAITFRVVCFRSARLSNGALIQLAFFTLHELCREFLSLPTFASAFR